VIATIELPPERTSFCNLRLRQIETLRMSRLLARPLPRCVRSSA
jgi:hypothetical protein